MDFLRFKSLADRIMEKAPAWIVLTGLVFGLLPALPAWAVNYIDTFPPTPFTGNPTTFTTAELKYDMANGDFQYEPTPEEFIFPLSFGGVATVTITAPDGDSFDFNNIWIQNLIANGITIEGFGPEPFTIAVDGNETNTFTPGGAKLVTRVEISGNELECYFDDVNVDINEPGMEIKGNGVTIANGDTSPQVGDDTDFGSTPAGTPVSKTFTISSIGGGSLDLTGSPYVTVSNTTDFSVSAQPTVDPIASRGTDTFTVRCNPSSAGDKTATVSIANDSEAHPYTFDVQCTGTADVDPPDVTINQAGGQADPTNGSPVFFTVVFDEPINEATFTNADVSVGGTATTGAVTVLEVAPNDDTTFEVSIAVSGDGTVVPTIPAGGVQDPAGNSNNASTSTDNSVTYDATDPTDPTPSSASHTVSVASNDNTIDITISGASDGSGSGVDGFEIEWDKSATWTPDETKEQEETWSGATFTAPTDGDWYFHLATVDNAGNWTSTVHMGPFPIDTDKPDVTINQAGGQADPTDTSPVLFTVVFDEPINDATFTNADVSVGGTATTGVVTVTEIAPNDDTTFSVSIVVTGDGTVQPSIPAGGVEDPAGNTNNASSSTDNTITYDTTKPDVTINQKVGQADPTNTSPVFFTAVFDEPINDATFTNVDVNVGGTATTGTVTVTEVAPNDDTTFEVSIVVTGDGTVQPTIPAGGVEDPTGNTNNASTSTDNSVTYDTTQPDVTINQAGTQAEPTNTSPVVFTAVFDEPINDATFTNADVNVGGTATTGTVTVIEIAPNDDTTFEVSMVVTADGTVQPTIPAGGVEDPAGNTNTVSTSTDNSVTVETVKPDVTINQKVGQADPTNTSPVFFTAVFDEPINEATFTNADVNVGGTATTGLVTVTEIAPNDDTTFEVSIVVTGDGTVVPTIPAGGVEDPAGNTNNASTSTDNSVTYDTTQPDVTIDQAGGQADPTNASPVTFTAVFDEPINDATFTNADVSVGGTATTGLVTVTEVAPNDDTTFEVSIVVTADGTVEPTIPAGAVEDPVGNTNTASTSTDNTVTYDTTQPDVTIDQAGAQADPTNISPVVFTAVFSEPINDATFTNADVNVGGTATTGAVTVTEIAPNDDTTFEVSIVVTADGTVEPTIPAGGAEDPAGNTNNSSTSTDNSVTVETDKPDVTIDQAGAQADPTNASPVVFTAVFNEPINDATFTNVDVNVGGTATTGAVTVTEIAPNDDTTFSVSVAVSGDGTVTATILADSVEDVAGNTNNASTSTDNTVTYDTTRPEVGINQAATQSDPTDNSPVVFTAVFNEPINTGTFTDGDVTIGGTATSGAVTVSEEAPNDGTTFSVSVVVTADGTVTATVPAGGVEDPAGNSNNASTHTDNSVFYDGLPDVTTQAVTDETNHSATANCNITDLGVPNPTAHGVVWNLAGGADPTLADNSTDEGAVGAVTLPYAFTSDMTGLDPNTDYAVRAYATNAAGTAYGNVLTFTTLPSAMPPVYYLLGEPEPTRRR
ncbi:MAG: choice-of-anchor D domain-containing protein [Thermodesulfobacteriota bacterium]|nr:choice-of-anchor D domain-containing protein [Thermodesulfobacteriota bacterium]